MFYSADLLTRRQGGFGLFWLVSTLGSKGSGAFKKVSRKEVIGCDLVDACNKLVTPDEPLALRLSSNLLCGIARIYQQQYNIYQSDVSQVQQSLKKAFTDVEAQSLLLKGADPTQGEAASSTGTGAINLAIDPTLAIVGLDVEYEQGMTWETFGKHVVDDFGPGEIEFGSGVERSDTPSSVDIKLRRLPTSNNQARDRASITLQELYLDNYEVKHDPAFLLGDEFGDDYNLGDYGEVGLLEGVSPQMDAALRAGSARSGSYGGYPAAHGGASSSATGFDQRQGMGDEQENIFAGMDFGGGDEANMQEGYQAGGSAPAKEFTFGSVRASSVPRNLMDDEFRDFGIVGPKRKSEDMLEDIEDENDPTLVRGGTAKPHTKKPNKKVRIDTTISLADVEVRAARSTYGKRMEQERKDASQHRKDKDGVSKALSIIFGVPDMYQNGPPLATFWQATVGNRLVPFGEGKARVGRKNSRGAEAKADPANYSRQQLAFDGNKPDSIDDILYDQDFGGGELEHGRGEGGQVDMGGAGEFFFDDPIDEGRAYSNLAGSQRNADLPWNLAAAGSDFGIDAFEPLGAGSSRTGTTRVSLDTPLRAVNKGRSRTGSLVPSSLESGSPLGRRAGSLLPVGRESDGIGEIGFDAEQALEVGPTQEAEKAIATLERESLNFLAYARRQITTDESTLFFSDIVPVASTNAAAASQALYHLLALASKDLVRIQQDEAYGNIQVELLTDEY